MTNVEIENLINLDDVVKKRVQSWLDGSYDQKTKDEIKRLIREDEQGLNDAFYKTLSFGTGGMREVMGVGSNRMNEYTVKGATQGFSNYLLKVYGKESKISVVIGYDSRKNSKKFAECAASVFAGNGIKVFLFEALRPTPLVSFACRFKGCKAGVMITASHNPPEYNGYKVFWDDGGQVLPPHDKGIIQEVEKVSSIDEVKAVPLPNALVELIGIDVDAAYVDAISNLSLYPSESKKFGKELKIVYTNLHGAGITIVPFALKRFGFTSVSYVEEQKEPDGNFPTTRYPNPEEKEALELGIQKLLKDEGDILLATDPDCDRIGVVVRHNGKAVVLTGNQIGAIAVEAICEALQDTLIMPKKAAFVKSIVTTDLIKRIAEAYGASCFDVMPGFRYISEKIQLWERQQNGHSFIFGAEESYGFLLGDKVRDKDGASTSCLISEIALKAKREGKTLVDLLNALYVKYGYFYESLFSLKFEEGKKGQEAQYRLMNLLREKHPTAFQSSTRKAVIVAIYDYKLQIVSDLHSKKQTKIELPASNVLVFELDDLSKVVIRPSGTEPKIKVYLMLQEPIDSSLAEAKAKTDAKAQALEKAVKKLLY
jgi:phosphomannomutase